MEVKIVDQYLNQKLYFYFDADGELIYSGKVDKDIGNYYHFEVVPPIPYKYLDYYPFSCGDDMIGRYMQRIIIQELIYNLMILNTCPCEI